MIIVLLTGDSGKRLWPLSNGVRSKQFIKCLKKEDGSYESMLQRIKGQIDTKVPAAQTVVVTSKSRISAVVNQLGEGVEICAEPVFLGDFTAVCLAAAYLRDIKNCDPREVIVFCPTDTFVADDYYGLLEQMEAFVRKNANALAMTAVTPTYPSGKYGYLKTDRDGRLTDYYDRPAETRAEELIAKGALWSGRIFAAQCSFWTNLLRKTCGDNDFEELYASYEKLPNASLEQKIISASENTKVFHYEGDWKTLGTWNTLTEAMEENRVGNALFDDSCENVHVVNELDVPILCMGLENVVVSASAEGILVSDKTHSSYIAPYVDQIGQRIMFADKSWGSYRVLDVEDESMTIKVTLNPGHSMNYHSHERRDEVWTIISGRGRTIVDGMEQPVKAGDVITMEAGCRHTIIADTELKMIEVQLGNEISVHDKKKYEFEI